MMIDLLIVLLFVAYSIYSGFSSKEAASKNLKEYFLAGSTLKGWQAGVSMAATQFAADTPLLVTGLIATGGIFLLWRLWIYGIAFLLMGFLFSTKWRRSGVITDAEFTTVRYSGRGVPALRFLKAIYYGTVINCTVMAMVLIAAMRISEVFLLWDQWLPADFYQVFYNIVASLGVTIGEAKPGIDAIAQTTNNLMSIFLILGFTTLYSTTGGLRSVVATDVMQFAFAMLGTLFYAGYILYSAGGFSGIVTKLESTYGAVASSKFLSFSPGINEALLPFLIIISLQWLFQMNSDGTGYLAQRTMGCKSDHDAKMAALLFTWLQIFLRSLIWLVIGVGLLVLYPFEQAASTADGFAAGREMMFVTGINDLLPVGIKGLMLTGMLGALASTLDTHLNWGASYWSNDVYQDLVCTQWLKREPDSKELVWVARLSNILILLIAIVIMFNLGSIQQAWTISLLFGAGMGGVLILRWTWERITLFSELAAICASIVVAPLLLSYVEADWLQLLLMSVISTGTAILVTFFTAPTDEAVLEKFYKKVGPQGFWKKTASKAGDDPKLPLTRLKSSLLQTILTALSLFLLLVGVGKMMFRPSDETLVLPIILILIGIALVPIWWKKANEGLKYEQS